MKTFYIDNLNSLKEGDSFSLYCWLKSLRSHGKVIFYQVVDSKGEAQVVLKIENFSEDKFKILSSVKEESALLIKGIFQSNELKALDVDVIAKNEFDFSPKPRSDFKIFDNKHLDHVLKNRNIYLRNKKVNSVLNFKSKYVFELHKYFQEKDYVLIEAPVLTEKLLYDDDTAFSFNYQGRDVWLSQCCTFQLEPSICSFEKVYNITPSFRAEHSRSDRHLNEYTHLKVEIAWAKLEDLIKISENLVFSVAQKMKVRGEKELMFLGHEIDLECLRPPYKRITYCEASRILNDSGCKFEWGKSLSKSDEAFLTKYFGEKPLWIQFIPRSAEGFPFKIAEHDERLTVVSDLIAPYGFGEILGAAEKICSKEELLKRMNEKGKDAPGQIERYQDFVDLRESGLPFHGGIGMGVDRVARFLMGLKHVKDVMPYPRLFGRRWNP